MEEKILKWLNINDLKILKQIIIVSDRQHGEYEIGQILYTRPLTKEYNFKNESQEKGNNKSESLIQEYPKQKNYPNDRIDDIIFDSVKKLFPKSILRHHSIFFNVDEEKIALLKNKNVTKSVIYFSPEFSKVVNVFEYAGKSFKAPRIGVNIYSYSKSDFLDGQIFYADYNVEEEDLLNKLNSVKFE